MGDAVSKATLGAQGTRSFELAWILKDFTKRILLPEFTIRPASILSSTSLVISASGESVVRKSCQWILPWTASALSGIVILQSRNSVPDEQVRWDLPTAGVPSLLLPCPLLSSQKLWFLQIKPLFDCAQEGRQGTAAFTFQTGAV